MIYSDNVKSRELIKEAWFNILVFVFISLLAYLLDIFADTLFGRLILEAIGDGEQAQIIARVFSSAIFGVLFLCNLHFIGRLPLKRQVLIVWIELLILFLYFFYSFDLELPFIVQKIGFMITRGVSTTLFVSAIAITIAFILALIGAIAKLSSNGFAIGIASFYTSFFRGLPLLMQIYLLYLGLPQLGFVIGAIPAGIIALSLCYGAYMTEIFRAGILSIPRGQWEASRALALSPYQTLAWVILPQAIRLIIPPTGNQFIAMLKDSSLVSVLGVWELMFLARTMGQEDFRHMEMLITAALLYWSLSIILERIQARIEVIFSKSKD